MAIIYPHVVAGYRYRVPAGVTKLRATIAGASGGDAVPVALRLTGSVSLVVRAATSPAALSLPAGVAAGDVLVLTCSETWNPSTGAPATVSVPAGWSLIGSTYAVANADGTLARRATVWWRTASASEPPVVLSSSATGTSLGSAGTTAFTVVTYRPGVGVGTVMSATPVESFAEVAAAGSVAGVAAQPGSGAHYVFSLAVAAPINAPTPTGYVDALSLGSSGYSLAAKRTFDESAPDPVYALSGAGEIATMSWAFSAEPSHTPQGGRGSIIVVDINVAPGQWLFIGPGQAGDHGTFDPGSNNRYDVYGGYPPIPNSSARRAGGGRARYGAGGGGAGSTILRGTFSNFYFADLIYAGGGGGAGSEWAGNPDEATGGAGGGPTGGQGEPTSGAFSGGGGGTQVVGGAGGVGAGGTGNNGSQASGGAAFGGSSSFRGGGGGGGGWFGGGGGGDGNAVGTNQGTGGGGGSDWVDPTYCTLIASYPGSNLGDGWIKISEGRRNITNRSRRLIPATRRTITLR